MEQKAFSVVYNDKGVDIDTDKFYTHEHPNAFMYANFCKGHGLQNNDPKTYNALMKLCDNIAKAIYDYQKEIKNCPIFVCKICKEEVKDEMYETGMEQYCKCQNTVMAEFDKNKWKLK